MVLEWLRVDKDVSNATELTTTTMDLYAMLLYLYPIQMIQQLVLLL